MTGSVLKRSFGESTVPLSRTEQQIHKLLDQHGIPRYPRLFQHAPEGPQMGQPGAVSITFRTAEGSTYRATVRYESAVGPRGGNAGSSATAAGRALYWWLKAKFDAVLWGIEEFESAFLAQMVDPSDGDATMFDWFQRMRPQLMAGRKES